MADISQPQEDALYFFQLQTMVVLDQLDDNESRRDYIDRQTDRQTDRHIYSTKCTSKQVVQVNNCAR